MVKIVECDAMLCIDVRLDVDADRRDIELSMLDDAVRDDDDIALAIEDMLALVFMCAMLSSPSRRGMTRPPIVFCWERCPSLSYDETMECEKSPVSDMLRALVAVASGIVL